MKKNISTSLRLDKHALSVAPFFDSSDEKAYWHSRTPEERLEHIESLRRINYGRQATARLQRFLEVVNAYGVEYLLVGGYAVG